MVELNDFLDDSFLSSYSYRLSFDLNVNIFRAIKTMEANTAHVISYCQMTSSNCRFGQYVSAVSLINLFNPILSIILSDAKF